MIIFNKKNKTFHLSGDNFSLLFAIVEGKLITLHYGDKLDDDDIFDLRYFQGFAHSPTLLPEYGSLSFNDRPLEFGEFGRGDFRTPSVIISGDGFVSTDYQYVSHKIFNKHPSADGLPTFSGGQTLQINFFDKLSDTTLSLFYTVYDKAIVKRSLISCGSKPVIVKKLMAGSFDLKGTFDIIGLYGSANNERFIDRSPLNRGSHILSSTRGDSSHQTNPFIALADKSTTEDFGKVYSFSLVYSGSFEIEAEVNQQHETRVVAGYNRDTFSYPLSEGQSLSSPELLCIYSNKGLGEMSRNSADTIRDFLIPKKYIDNPRPIVINNWEATAFSFNDDILCSMIEKVKGLGIDTFVLDDGWFGERDDDDRSLGDWFIFKKKLPVGFDKIIKTLKKCNMKFGLWFEPEMISENSELFRNHPDFVLKTNGRVPLTSRRQWVLDFSKDEVVDNIFSQMESILSSYDISYIKWDMNRSICDMPDFTTQHNYILGVYKLADRLQKRFPNLFMEGCASGGGRYDLGMMKFFPQIWCSDNTDAQARCHIQYGSSLAYPLCVSSNHVSKNPNIQTGRLTLFKTRGDVAMLGAFGYELNPNHITEEEFSQIKSQTKEYREIEQLILRGDLYRHDNPFDGETFCMELSSKDKKLDRITFVSFTTLGGGRYPFRIYPKGLDENLIYDYNGKKYSGKTLMSSGIDIKTITRDNISVVITLKAI